MKDLRILLADNQLIFIEGLKNLIESAYPIIATATDGRSLVSLAEQLCPDVVVTEINMPRLSGLEVCERLRSTVPNCRTIFLAASDDLETAEEAIRRGAFGYVPKKAAVTELLKAIQSAAVGRVYISSLISREPVSIFLRRAKSREHREPLSFRQREVLQLLAEGKSMKEAADILRVSARTIAFHKYAMMEHLGFSRNAELVRYAGTSQAGGWRPEACHK